MGSVLAKGSIQNKKVLSFGFWPNFLDPPAPSQTLVQNQFFYTLNKVYNNYKLHNMNCLQDEIIFYTWAGHSKRPECEVHRLDISKYGFGFGGFGLDPPPPTVGQLWGSLNNNFIYPYWSKMVQNRLKLAQSAHFVQQRGLWLKYFKIYGYFCICLYDHFWSFWTILNFNKVTMLCWPSVPPPPPVWSKTNVLYIFVLNASQLCLCISIWVICK